MNAKIRILSLLITLWIAEPAPAQKVLSYYGETGTDIFSEPGNWSDETVPGPEDTALLSLSGEYSIELTEDATFAKLRMREGGNQAEPDKVTLQLGGNTLTLLGTEPGEENEESLKDSSLVISASSQASRTLVFEGGILRLPGYWQATMGGTSPSVLIFDQGMTIESTGMGYVGAYGPDETYILGGSKWESNGKSWAGVLGLAAKAWGLMEISGEGTSFSAKTALGTPPLDVRVFFVSANGSGFLRILDGATFECDTVCMGLAKMDLDAVSTIVVDGMNSRFSVDRLYVGGGGNNIVQQPRPSGNALFYVSNGAVADVGALRVFSRDVSEGAALRCGKVLIDGGTLNIGVDAVDLAAEFAPHSQLEFRLRGVENEARIYSEAEFSIDGAELIVTLDPAFRASVGDEIPLVSCPIVKGTFRDLPEGALIQADGYTFALSYNLDGSSGIALTVTEARP